MYSVELVESAQKDFNRLDKEDQKRVVAVLERISVRPYSFVLRLSGSRAFRVRVGKFRVILDILDENNKIVVLKIGNRESIYLP
jgi:mRNA interferase RelE/StbE